jgi:interferon gamma-inducible protein 30
MFMQLLVAIALLAVVFGQEYPKVPVEVYYEALCPGCQQFITGPLTNTLALSDIAAIVDLKMVPYGNTKKAADGSFSCQHGVDECTSDVLELCTMYKLSNNITAISTGENTFKAWPFIQCMELNEGDPTAAPNCFATTMAKSGLSYTTVTECAANEASAVQNQGALATPSHDYVPWVLVNGSLLSNNNLLTPAICKAYTGPTPASCKKLVKKEADVCFNK